MTRILFVELIIIYLMDDNWHGFINVKVIFVLCLVLHNVKVIFVLYLVLQNVKVIFVLCLVLQNVKVIFV